MNLLYAFIIPVLGVITTDVFHHANCAGERPFPITHLFLPDDGRVQRPKHVEK